MLCSLSRLQMSNGLEHRGGLSWPARVHAQRCDGCRAFARKLYALHGHLAASVAAAPAPARPERSRARLPVAVAMLAAGAAAVLLYVALGRTPERAAVPPVARPVVVVAQTPAAPPSGADTPAIALVQQAGDLMAAPPLRDELSALMNDGRRATLAVLDQAGLHDRAP